MTWSVLRSVVHFDYFNSLVSFIVLVRLLIICIQKIVFLLQFELKITVVPNDAILKLDGVKQELINGQYIAQVAQRTRLVVEVDHSEYEMQTHTIEMPKGDKDVPIELVSCQELKNCKPNWSAWGPWNECVPRCYNKYSERTKSIKERTRYYLPDSSYLQDDWKGEEKEIMPCSIIPKCPWDKLKTIHMGL